MLTRFYGDRRFAVGQYARESLPSELLARIEFRNPSTAADIGLDQDPGSIQLLFIDGDHCHPWPTLDLLAALPFLAPFATVVLHDINLPLIHPQYAEWGVKHLFDGLSLAKRTSEELPLPNAGSFVVPAERDELWARLLQIMAAHPWEKRVRKKYLKRLGADVVAAKGG